MLLFRNFVIAAVFLVLILVFFVRSKPAVSDETKTLKQVHVVFRHGDRTNFPPSYYPTDPHVNETFYPYGLGELTNTTCIGKGVDVNLVRCQKSSKLQSLQRFLTWKHLGQNNCTCTYLKRDIFGPGYFVAPTLLAGLLLARIFLAKYYYLDFKGKKKEFRIGKALRERYAKFLGTIYTPDLLKAYTTDTSRTKMSLQLVLAGLFPPTGDQIWEETLPWQPIPYEYAEKSRDKIFKAVQCPKYIKMYKDIMTSPEFQAEFEKDKTVIDYLSEHTGKTFLTYKHVYNVFAGLTTESEFGLELPSWTRKIFPKPMADVAVKYYEWFVKTVPQKKIVLGYLLKKIINDSENVQKSNSSKKLFLYSGHELNVAALLSGLGAFSKPHVPPYGSFVLVEVHQIDEVYGFKFFYQDYTTPDVQRFKMSGCEEFCRFEEFVALVQDILPDDQSCGNEEPEPELYSY